MRIPGCALGCNVVVTAGHKYSVGDLHVDSGVSLSHSQVVVALIGGGDPVLGEGGVCGAGVSRNHDPVRNLHAVRDLGRVAGVGV